MTTITRERVAEIIHAAGLEPCDYEEVFGSIKTGEIVAMARIALTSLESEPVAWLLSGGGAKNNVSFDSGNAYADPLREVTPLYTTPPAQRMPDMNGFRPCPFCNSPVKWCGENSVDPDDEHVCHHIQCTNPECGADFDFINTGDDLLPDDPETLDAMTAAECLQPLRNVCLNRFNSRAAMLHGTHRDLSYPVDPQEAEYEKIMEQAVPDGWVMVPKRLTAENGAKAALIGEFSLEYSLTCHECFGEGCEDCSGEGAWTNTVPIDWATIKDIWAKAIDHFAAAPQQEVK